MILVEAWEPVWRRPILGFLSLKVARRPSCRALSPIPVVLSIAPPTYLHSLGVDPSHKAIVGITSPRSGRFEVNKCHETFKTVDGWQ